MINPGELEQHLDQLERKRTVLDRMRELIKTSPGYLAHAFLERSRTREADGPAVIGAAIEYVKSRFPDRSETQQAALREAWIAGYTTHHVEDQTKHFEADMALPLPPDVSGAA